jgi:CRP-like cAMP-binding protein/NAD-dependent dihydropyrimidine dehydrogenase PreA subunit
MSTEPTAELLPQDRDDRDVWEWEEEGLFVRDIDGRLIRYDKATKAELDKDVSLEIDGETIVVKKAVVATDEQGNFKYDADGEVIPRPTTIYDAVSQRYGGGDGADRGSPSGSGVPEGNGLGRKPGERNNPIPILCHTKYMDPVAVCRVCVVQLARFKRSTGRVEVDTKLLPACQHRVEEGMIVDTIASGCDLRLMSPVKNVSDIPTKGKDRIIVAAVDQVLHFRIFDADGQMVVDTDERRLTEQARPIEGLREQLVSLWPPHRLTRSEKDWIITAVPSVVGHTLKSPREDARRRIEGAVKTLVELLIADHPSPCAKERQHPGECELEALARQFDVVGSRFPGRVELRRDDSSLVIAVDHNACILCDRCVRGCDVIKENHVIGRMGKGYTARIAFDLDAPMGGSTCVACGECSDDCPTGALTHRDVVPTELPDGEVVNIESLLTHQIPEISRACLGVSRPFLHWNSRAVVRRRFRAGDVICRESEFGRTAFMIESGTVEVFLKSPLGHIKNQAKRGFLGAIGRFAVGTFSRSNDDRREGEDHRPFIPIDAPVALPYGKPVAPLGPGDIFGEMTCMSLYPRSATVVAVEECSVLEMLRNVLYIMQRDPSFRRDLEEKYRDRAVDNLLRTAPLFGPLRPDEGQFDELVGRLRGRKSPRRCEPGEVILRQGERGDDGVFLVRSGFVKVSRSESGREQVLNYVGPGGYLGELGMLAQVAEFRDLAPPGGRSATCTALDRVELVEIASDEFPSLAPFFARERQLNQLIDRLRRRVTLRRFEPGEMILRQGAPAVEGLYLVRTGFVKVSESRPGGERVLNYVGPGGYIGEIGLLSDFPEFRDQIPAGVRTATCTALDHVDLVRIPTADFRELLEDYPAVKAAVIEEARRRLESNRQASLQLAQTSLGDFLDQGLMNAKALLVLDLQKCTRCDECTKACADTHQGVTRLIREGLRFDKYLVASSCRSCLDPYCLVGCPVGSISRSPEGEIRIADWCIGCTLCAQNCPYGNINMVQQYNKSLKADVRKATTCDLCKSLGPNSEPSCVYACPHDAAHRMSGMSLLDIVRGSDAEL